jgi:hypothetical protein
LGRSSVYIQPEKNSIAVQNKLTVLSNPSCTSGSHSITKCFFFSLLRFEQNFQNTRTNISKNMILTQQGMLVRTHSTQQKQTVDGSVRPYPFSTIGFRSTCLNAGRKSGELSGVWSAGDCTNAESNNNSIRRVPNCSHKRRIMFSKRARENSVVLGTLSR